jgi:hypothetical protein
MRLSDLAATAEALIAAHRETLSFLHYDGLFFVRRPMLSVETKQQLSEIAEAMVTGYSDLAPELSFRDGLWCLKFYRPIRAEWRGSIACVLRQAEQFASIQARA